MKKILPALLFAVATGNALAVSEPPGAISRTTTYTLHLGALDFSNAYANYDNVVHFDTLAHPAYSNTLTVDQTASSISFVGLGSTVLTHGALTPGTDVPFTVTSPGGAGQGMAWNEDYAASTVAGVSAWTIGQGNGRYTLSFGGGGRNDVVVGAHFYSSVILPGDWSDPTSHSADTYGAGYTLLNNFTFANGVTTFAIETDNWNLINPGIKFTLYGAAVTAVPEPSTYALLLGGLAFIGTRARRRRT